MWKDVLDDHVWCGPDLSCNKFAIWIFAGWITANGLGIMQFYLEVWPDVSLDFHCPLPFKLMW